MNRADPMPTIGEHRISSAGDAPKERAGEFGPPPRVIFGVLACYFILQVILRVTFSTSVDLDESEAAVLSQKFSWGYSSDPPLYAWLQMLFFGLFGPSVLGLSVLKNLLLFSTYCLTFATARLVTQSRAGAVAASLSLLYLPQIAWESQRDLTHSVLSATLAVATLFCCLRLHQTRRLSWYVLFGCCAGCGILSKYNYSLWLLGLFLAGLSLREFRPALLDKRMLPAIAIAVLICLPNGLWMLNHRDLALLNSSKFQFQQSVSWAQGTWTGFRNIVQSVFSFCTPLAILYLLLFINPTAQPGMTGAPNPLYRSLILRAWLVIGGLLALLVVFTQAAGFKERWFQPILVVLPIAAISLVHRRLTPVRLKCMAGLSVLVMATVALVMPGRLLAAERLKREEPLTRPYAQLASEISPVVSPGALVVCDDRPPGAKEYKLLLAGNMRLGLPQATVINPELWPVFRGSYPQCFLVWDARKTDSPPPELSAWAQANPGPGTGVAAPHYFSAVYRFHHSKAYRLGLMQLY